jgi:Elongation factor G C-terminus
MDASKPLQTLVRPKTSAFVLKFARDLVPLFAHSERIAAEATANGLVIGSIWEPDLDDAYELVRAAYAGELVWGPTQINYVQDRWPQEPVLLVQVQTPDDYLGNVIGDLCSRRAIIIEHKKRGEGNVVTAEAPLAELTGYLAALDKLTNGTASATAEFHSYQTAPRNPGPPDEPMSAALRA